MTKQILLFIFNWVCNNYDVRDVGGWHIEPKQMLAEYLEEFKVEEEKKDDSE